MKRLQKYIFILAFFLCTQVSLSDTDPAAQIKADIERVSELYRSGRIDDAELLALRLINIASNLSTMDRAELYRILAFIAIARDDRDRGLEFFLKALGENPQLRLDRALTSPKILSVFERAQQEYEQPDRQQQRQIAEELSEMPKYRLRLEATTRSLMLPGLGQLHKGQKNRGIAYLAATGITLAGVIVSHVAVVQLKNDYQSSREPEKARQNYELYRDAWHWRTGFTFSLAAVWIASTCDALITDPAPQAVQPIRLGFSPVFQQKQSFSVSLSLRF